MGKQKMTETSLELSPQTKSLRLVRSSSVAVPGEGGRVLVPLDCAMLAGWDQNAAWLLRDVWFFSCCTLPLPPTFQSSLNLAAAHPFSLPPSLLPRLHAALKSRAHRMGYQQGWSSCPGSHPTPSS